MKAILVFACVLLAASAAQAIDFEVDANYTLFTEYMREYRKEYSSMEEMVVRFANFKNSLTRIAARNAADSNAKFAINKFSDMSVEEFKAKYLNYKGTGKRNVKVTESPAVAIPTTYDWRTKGCITPVKDQQQCGSCWAFSATEEIESMWILSNHAPVALSPQQIVSCDTQDAGCNGGDTVSAYEYIEKAGGIESNQAYPYTSGGGNTGTCKFNKANVAAKISGFEYATDPCTGSCSSQNLTKLANNLVNVGPVSICVYAESWMDYSSGVLSSNCPHGYSDLDHCVQLVGFNNWASDSSAYWIVRNSWNTDWGVEGYIYISTANNLCGVADEATIVQI